MQELGPKKYRKLQEESFKNYDKYKAGKTDPKTGVYYNTIDFGNPASKKNSAMNMAGCLISDFRCPSEGCDNWLTVRRNTAGICCSKCNKYHSIKVDKETEEFTVNGIKIND